MCMKKLAVFRFKLAGVLAIGTALCGVPAVSAVDNLYVVRLGDGVGTLGTAAAPVFIDKFDITGGTALSSIALPTTTVGSNFPLTLGASSPSMGHLQLSTNGQFLTLGGYSADAGTATVRESTVPRVVGRVEISTGSVNTTTALTDAYIGGGSGSGDNGDIRSVMSTDGTEFWTAGTTFPATGGVGVRYTTLGSTTSVQLSSSVTNTRVVSIFNNQLYVSAASGTFQGVSTVGTGVPEPTNPNESTTTLLPGFPTAPGPSPYDFWFKDADTLYVADDRSQANGGGIQKWTQSAGTWSLAYTLSPGSGTRSLQGTIVGGHAVLYATTAPNATSGTVANSIVSVTDTGAGSAFSTLATSGTNRVFRGIEFVSSGPVPIPGDFDSNGKVDSADYVYWRDNGLSQAQYDEWKGNFGFGGPGASSILGSPVPEPAGLVLLLTGLAGLSFRRRAVR